jgi:hypothetical protein
VAKKKEKVDLKDEKKREQINMLYRTRLTHLKRAQILVKEDRMAQAVDSYTKYLGILGLYFDLPEEKLSPSLFNPEKDVTEMLLISHAYWDLAKAFDRSPHLQADCFRCLDQFVKFSIGFKYQHVNAQIVRKFNNKKQAHNPKAFEQAYQRIQISSKKCYVASFCFGEEHSVTNDLRLFKMAISKYKLGLDFIDYYYQFSPNFIDFLNRHHVIGSVVKTISKPFLIFTAFVTRKLCRSSEK